MFVCIRFVRCEIDAADVTATETERQLAARLAAQQPARFLQPVSLLRTLFIHCLRGYSVEYLNDKESQMNTPRSRNKKKKDARGTFVTEKSFPLAV